MEERFEELAALNALGMLEGDEKRTLDGVIVRDHALKNLCTELEAAVAELAGAVTPFAPPAALKGRIRAKIRSRRTGAAKHSGNYWAFTGWAAAAALAVSSASRSSAICPAVEGYKQGVAVVVWDSEKHQGVLKLEKMPPVQVGKDYQLWVVDPKQPVPVDAGIVRVDSTGFAKVDFKPVTEVTDASKFALSVEKEGGVPKGEGPIVLIGP